jgi:hypothetical protein
MGAALGIAIAGADRPNASAATTAKIQNSTFIAHFPLG